jgi:hypothetical protein
MSDDAGETRVYITDPIMELVAIKLYEHGGDRYPQTLVSWLALPEVDREEYREMARGNRPIYQLRDCGE